jgi:hypothetical protein
MLKACEGCDIYKDRVNIAEMMEELFGDSVKWDYNTCKFGCPNRKTKSEISNIRCAKERYHRQHPEAQYNIGGHRQC